MTPRSLAGLALTVAALTSAFMLMAPTAPGLFVGVLTVGTFGFGPFYGEPSRQLVDRPWRRDRRTRALARRVRVDWLSRQLGAAGWNAAIRRRITGRDDLRRIRTVAVGALVSHAASAGLHVAAGAALAVVGHPVWGVIALALGALVHAWPALLQVSVLGRIDELQAQIRGRQLLW
ncbi:hypothetical protein JSY14_08160 [Brachybacterium sp. EF45031]|uniref:hypothetical protein n=1 Tax=Brachybacterium sillae TaxID=2810536 RepID=UPI00217CD0A1|nr:hypothetical protein [Brachybacterium sillae]MCS6711993.1 hypothetical protein [Brachybacterium sillae]